MDLSINKIKKQEQKNDLNFKGIKGVFLPDNSPVLRFNPPPFRKGKERVVLQIAMPDYDNETNSYLFPKEDDIEEIDFIGDKPIELRDNKMAKYANAIAYRYKITSNDGSTRYATDGFKSIKSDDGKELMNIIYLGNGGFGISPKAGTMRHTFVDSDVALDKENKPKPYDKNFVRNHFNVLGGSTKGLLYLLTNTDELDPYTWILSTPDIGVDKISSHKYWPNNLYQCNDMDAFKKFNFELFKRGKGYIADGAFTSQGLESPIVQHILKWGQDSPFYNMLKIDGRIQLGILPDKNPKGNNPLEHIGIKVVNPVTSEAYNKKLPTYIQFYDDRLASQAQLENPDTLIETYDNPNPKDHYETVSHQDSVIPYYFEIDPSGKKASVFKDENYMLLKDIPNLGDFLTFPNFTITDKEHASGASFWDGNRDIIKMNLSNPDITKENQEGLQNARNYLFGVATFWTEAIQSYLVLNTALSSEKEKKEIAKNNGIDSAKYDEIKELIAQNKVKLPILENAKPISQYIKEFPLQSIETHPALSAIFAQPQFNKELFDSKTLSKLETSINAIIKNSIPEEYQGNEQYRLYVEKLYTNTIIRQIIINAIDPGLIQKDGSTDLEKLKTTGINSLTPKAYDPEEERHLVVSKIKKNINSFDALALQNKIKDELIGINLEDFKLAESIVLQGQGGLGWRFDAAKDIADLDSVRDGTTTFDFVWNGDELHPGVRSFWETFINNIYKYNPSAFTIAEVTSLSEFAKFKDIESGMAFDPKLTKKFQSKSEDEQNIWEEGVVYELERTFHERVHSTTGSNYDKYFNNLSNFIGVDPEHGYDINAKAGDVKALKGLMETFIKYANPREAIYTHMFFDNHDKPRLLHTLPLDMNLFLFDDVAAKGSNAKNFSEANPVYKQMAYDVTGSDDYENMSSKAIAVAYFMKGEIEKAYENDPETKEKLLKALSELALGKKNSSSPINYKRAQAFGFLPFDVTLKDVFERAGVGDFEYEKILSSMNKYEEKLQNLWQVMNALVGTPTMFLGTEFGQTGYETPSKNEYVGNREPVNHDLRNSEYHKERVDKFYAISSMYKQQGLSAKRGSTPISLNTSYVGSQQEFEPEENKEQYTYFKEQIARFTNETKTKPELLFAVLKSHMDDDTFDKLLKDSLKIKNENNNYEIFKTMLPLLEREFTVDDSTPLKMWPIFKYDDKGSRVVELITNNGVNTCKKIKYDGDKSFVNIAPENKKKIYKVSSIPIKDKEGNCPFEDGTVLRKKVYDKALAKYVDDGEKYVVKEGRIVNANKNRSIIIEDTTATFYAPNDEKENMSYMAYLYNGTH